MLGYALFCAPDIEVSGRQFQFITIGFEQDVGKNGESGSGADHMLDLL